MTPPTPSEALAEEIERVLTEYHRAVELDDASLLPAIMSKWCDLFFKPGASAILAALRARPPEGMVLVPMEPNKIIAPDEYDDVLFDMCRNDDYAGLYREFIRRAAASSGGKE